MQASSSLAPPIDGAERIGAVVYLDTSPLPDGLAIVDVLSPELRERERDADGRERAL